MEPATFVMIAALPIMLVFGALALWLTQRPARAVAAPSSANDVVSDGLNIRATMIYLEADGKLLGLAVQIQRLHGRRRNADVLLTGFDAFDERHGRARLFDLSRIMTLVDADSGELVISPAKYFAERAGLVQRNANWAAKAVVA